MKQDHRVRITKMLLTESFVDLLREKPIAKITVREICDRAGVNRATFYAHYRDIDDLKNEIEDALSDAITHSVLTSQESASIEAFCNEICRIIVENRSWCEAVFGENGDPELPVRIIERMRVEGIAAWKRRCPDASPSDLERLYTFASSGSLAVVSCWVQSGMRETPDEIAQFIGTTIKSCLEGL